ncbi:MAG: Flp family type IVb pilin [Candidatus Eremiobacteraeota bacterium]|nr:Flp family type IVb pilin [Candidatus Eremiobacteraeota bacterium]
MIHYLRAMLKDETGVTLLEYALLMSLIAVVCILAIKLVGTNTSTMMNTAAHSL